MIQHELLIKTLMEDQKREQERLSLSHLALSEKDIVRQEVIDQLEHRRIVKQTLARLCAVALLILLLMLGYSRIAGHGFTILQANPDAVEASIVQAQSIRWVTVHW